ncbi:MAG: hypothetical protein ACE5FD_10980 [Anaerolineae bacterium]
MSTMTLDQIVEKVQVCLDKNPPAGYRLNVDPAGVRQDDDWWYVTVVPDKPGVRAYDYANALTEIEEQLGSEGSINILLVPTLVDD